MILVAENIFNGRIVGKRVFCRCRGGLYFLFHLDIDNRGFGIFNNLGKKICRLA